MNDSKLTLKLSDGRRVAVDHPKSILQFTTGSQRRRCAIVQGPQGTAVYNATGEVQVNGAPATAHLLQPGDRLKFGADMVATVERLQALAESIDQPSLDPTAPAPAGVLSVDVASQQDVFKPATDAANIGTPAPVDRVPEPAPVRQPEAESFSPATQALNPVADLAPVVPEPAPVRQPEAESFSPATQVLNPVADLAPVAPEPAPVPQPVAPQPTNLVAPPAVDPFPGHSLQPAIQPPAPVPAAVSQPAPVQQQPAPIEPTSEATAPEATGLAAEILRQIQAEQAQAEQVETNEAVGQSSLDTHSPLADVSSFEQPEVQQPVVVEKIVIEPPVSQSLVSESLLESLGSNDDPTETVPAAAQESQPAAEAEHEPGSVAALLAKMKQDGQWDGMPEDNEPAAATPPSAPEPAPEKPAPAAAVEANDDVDSYMSQLLNRMRSGASADEPQQSADVVTQDPGQPSQPEEQPVEPERVDLLRPEDFVPKSKAGRVQGWQGMRELANTQTRTAIDRSEKLRQQKSISLIQLIIGLVSGIMAIAFWMGTSFGGVSACIAGVCAICSGFALYKSYTNVLSQGKKVVVERAVEAEPVKV